jgi:hypothetical protein
MRATVYRTVGKDMKKAIKVCVPVTKALHCHFCGGTAYLEDNSIIYGESKGSGKSYVCENFPRCNTYIAAHAGNWAPMGTLANAKLRRMRSQCHGKFDKLWRGKAKMTRKDAYIWLADKMGVDLDHAHFGCFTEDQCKRFLRREN